MNEFLTLNGVAVPLGRNKLSWFLIEYLGLRLKHFSCIGTLVCDTLLEAEAYIF